MVWGSSSPFGFSGLVQFCCKQSGFCRFIFDMPRSGDRRIWDVHFIRGPNDWEVDVVDDFFQFLAPNLPLVTDGDRMRWKTKNEDFIICSYYHKLHGSSSVVFPWKGIWKVKAPRCVSFFVWTAA